MKLSLRYDVMWGCCGDGKKGKGESEGYGQKMLPEK